MNPQHRSAIGKSVGGLALASFAVLSGMKALEKQVLEVYPDHLARGLPTFCSGRTDWSAKIGKKFTQAECDAIDAQTAEEYGRGILACTKHENLTQDVFDALTLFAVNVGVQGACGSRAVRLINQGLIKDGCNALLYGPNGQMVWVYADGKFVRGLANRRAFEVNWCLKGAGVL